jgi:hypothetical protein
MQPVVDHPLDELRVDERRGLIYELGGGALDFFQVL